MHPNFVGGSPNPYAVLGLDALAPYIGVSEASREARASLDDRIAKLAEIRAAAPGEHRVIWHDLEDERRAIEAAFPDVATVYGSQDLEEVALERPVRPAGAGAR
jgi:hypothetical protein